MSRRRLARRRFVQETAAGLAFTIVPSRVLGRRQRPPSDKLNVACIGAGGMGRNDVRGVAGETVVAICDVDWEAAAESFRANPQARRYRDYREMLDRERDRMDAVTISTPDHSHAAAAILALRAGKHVYCQKPLTRAVAEARAVSEAAAQRPRLVTQMGNQGHANEGTRLIREWVEAGLIGAVREVHYWTNRPIWPQGIRRPTEAHNPPPTLDWNLWLGPAPERPYHPAYAPFRWRGWWDFGTGALGDMACHLMDAAYWALDLGYPSRIEAEASELLTETAPKASRVAYQFPARGTRPAVTVVWRDGGLMPPKPAEWPGEQPWPPSLEGGQLWIGERGKLVAGIYGESPRLLDQARMAELQANPLPVVYPRVQSVYAEWIEACKAGRPAGSPFAGHAGGLTEMVLLGCVAQRLGGVLEVDPQSGRILTSGVPEEWIRPTYRQGWRL